MPDTGGFTPTRILVAVGGNSMDAEAMIAAGRLAKLHAAKVYAIHVIELARSVPLGVTVDADVEAAERVLDAAEAVADSIGLKVETELLQARDPGAALIGEAEEWGADLIVMGVPYRKRLGEFNLGKTIMHVLRHSTARVVLLREALPAR